MHLANYVCKVAMPELNLHPTAFPKIEAACPKLDEEQIATLAKFAASRQFKAGETLLAREGYDPVYGARPLRRAIQKEILDPLSIDILEGKVREGQTVHVDAKDGALEFRAT